MTEHIGKSGFASGVPHDAENVGIGWDAADWEKRLQAASAHREQVLAQRKAAENSPLRKTLRPVMPETLQKRLVEIVPAPHAWNGVFVKFCMVFVAAFGFGMGAMMGLGILAQQRGMPEVQTAAAVQATPDIAPVAASVFMTAPYNPLLDPEKSALLMPVAAAAVLPAAPEKAILGPEVAAPPAPVPVLTAADYSEFQDSAQSTQPVDFAGLEAFVAPELGSAPQWIGGVFSGDTVSVYLHIPDGVSQAQVTKLIARLGDNGVEVAKVGREPFRVSSTHLRYYAEGTAPAAQAVADTLGVDARDFSGDRNIEGRIELWVRGRPLEGHTGATEPRRGFLGWLFALDEGGQG